MTVDVNFLAISPTSPEAQAFLREMKDRADRMGRGSREVCACGHSLKYHQTDVASGYVLCKPGKIGCGCSEERAVLRASNLRRFLHKTSEPGYGMGHALSKGVAASLGAGELVEWIRVGTDGAVLCDACGSGTGFVDGSGKSPVYPIAFDARQLRAVDGLDAKTNRVMCLGCAQGILEHGVVEWLSRVGAGAGASAKA
jgi:hypothetical protein